MSDSVIKNDSNEINKDNEDSKDNENTDLTTNQLSQENELRKSPKPIEYSLETSSQGRLKDDVDEGKQNFFIRCSLLIL